MRATLFPLNTVQEYVVVELLAKCNRYLTDGEIVKIIVESDFSSQFLVKQKEDNNFSSFDLLMQLSKEVTIQSVSKTLKKLQKYGLVNSEMRLKGAVRATYYKINSKRVKKNGSGELLIDFTDFWAKTFSFPVTFYS